MFDNLYILQITCAEPERFLHKLANSGIILRDVIKRDEFSVELKICGKYVKVFNDVADRCGCDVHIQKVSGLASIIAMCRRRFVLFVCFAMLLFLTLYIPSRILFVFVDGNSFINSEKILQAAELVGISFGADRKDVRSEKVKNALLKAIPDLKWVGVNTYGCVAIISVTERENINIYDDTGSAVRGIYASRDGIISSITVTKGTALCKLGEAVTAGQLLVSGYTDCGLHVRAERAQGDVRAVTRRKINAVTPNYQLDRNRISVTERNWSIQIGKKRIKLYKGSGNSTTSCGKIYETYEVILPGGFKLPLAVVKETVIHYESGGAQIDAEDDMLKKLACNYILGDMLAGNVIDMDIEVSQDDDFYTISGVFTCDEIIGRLQKEGI